MRFTSRSASRGKSVANSKRKCGGCGERFRVGDKTFPGLVAWCSPDCGYVVAQKRLPSVRKAQEREARAEHRKAREKIKTRSEWAAEAQAAVNSYVRERDKGKPCISCDKPDDGSHQRHASHYRSVKACSILRYDPRNIYASCAQCNAHMSGNLLEYRIRLIRKHGQDLVEWLESQNGIVRYTIDDLKAIKAEYKAKLKALKGK